MFDRLIELVTLISKTKIQQVEIIDEKHNYNTKVQHLYEGINNGRFKSDKDAVKTLYQTDDISYNAYVQLRYQLERRLLNTLFHIDITDAKYTDLQVAHYNCHRQMAQVAILAGRAASKEALALAERTLKVALQYEFTGIVLELLNVFLHCYSLDVKNIDKYWKYFKLHKECLKLYVVEKTAMMYNTELKALHIGRKWHDKTHLERAIIYANELEELLKTYQSYAFCSNAFYAICTRYELECNYKLALDACNRAIVYFQKEIGLNYRSSVIGFFLHKKLNIYITLNFYEKARGISDQILENLTEGGVSWYLMLEECIALNFHVKNYIKAYDLLLKAFNNTKYKGLQIGKQKRWETYHAYTYYFIEHHQLKLVSDKRMTFIPYDFFTDIPVFDKEQYDINVPILLLHVLFLLKAARYDDVTNRVEILRTYFTKKLINNHTFRANCLVKMFSVMVDAKFNKAATIRKATSYVKKLELQSLEKSKQASNVEFVPYEHIWTCALGSLRDNFWHKR